MTRHLIAIASVLLALAGCAANRTETLTPAEDAFFVKCLGSQKCAK